MNEDLLASTAQRRQHALEELVRLALEIIAILEGAGLALSPLTAIRPRPLLGAHQPPLAPRGEPRAAEAAQAAIGERRDHVFHLARAGEAGFQHAIATRSSVRVEVLVGRHVRMHVAFERQLSELRRRGMVDMAMADLGCRRRVARADARRTHDPHAVDTLALQRAEQLLGAGKRAAQTVADADRNLGWPRLSVLDHIDVGVKRRNLLHLRHRDLEFFGERRQVPGGEASLLVLDQVQILDQQRALARPRRGWP